MPNRTRAILALVVFASALSACSQERVQIVRPPVSLTQCDDEPTPPELPDRTQQLERDRLVLEYILSLRDAWGDCSAKVDGIRAWSDGLD